MASSKNSRSSQNNRKTWDKEILEILADGRPYLPQEIGKRLRGGYERGHLAGYLEAMADLKLIGRKIVNSRSKVYFRVK